MIQSVSYLWREPKAAEDSPPECRCTAIPTSRRRRWTSSPSSPPTGASAAADALGGAALPADHRNPAGLRAQLLDPAADAPARLRPGAHTDRREATDAGDGLAHRPRRHPGADAAALARFGAADSRLAGVDGALWFLRGAVGLPPGHSQPAQRHRSGVDAAHGGVHGHPGGRAPGKAVDRDARRAG